jgi:peptide-methionine (R)-S-oxide reductase
MAQSIGSSLEGRDRMNRDTPTPADGKVFPVTHTEDEWRRLLTPEQYTVLRGHGTERPGSCALLREKRAGAFSCAGCGQKVFVSGRKFESGTGWPSFDTPVDGSVETSTDRSYGMMRT